jgi:hypothetical protein
MATTRHTRIDELATFGYELAEEHLVLAAGGRPNVDLTVPKPKTVQQYVSTSGPRLFDERYDW